MNTREFKNWVSNHVHLRTVPVEQWPNLVAALREFTDEIERAYQESRGGQP